MGQTRKVLIELAEDTTDDQLASIVGDIKDEWPDFVAGVSVQLWEEDL